MMKVGGTDQRWILIKFNRKMVLMEMRRRNVFHILKVVMFGGKYSKDFGKNMNLMELFQVL